MPYPKNLKKSLIEHNVDISIIQRIYEGFENIEDKSSKKIKISFMRRTMKILDECLDFEKRCEIMEKCACCLGGYRQKNIKKFFTSIEGQNMTLEKKIRTLRESRLFSDSTRLNKDGTITDGVYYQVDNEYKCACTCLSEVKLEEPISATYCLCCAGHFRHHLQNALGVKLRTKKIASSSIESLGKEPCEFVFEVTG